jgi:hypothetical protein
VVVGAVIRRGRIDRRRPPDGRGGTRRGVDGDGVGGAVEHVAGDDHAQLAVADLREAPVQLGAAGVEDHHLAEADLLAVGQRQLPDRSTVVRPLPDGPGDAGEIGPDDEVAPARRRPVEHHVPLDLAASGGHLLGHPRGDRPGRRVADGPGRPRAGLERRRLRSPHDRRQSDPERLARTGRLVAHTTLVEHRPVRRIADL